MPSVFVEVIFERNRLNKLLKQLPSDNIVIIGMDSIDFDQLGVVIDNYQKIDFLIEYFIMILEVKIARAIIYNSKRIES